MDTRLLSNGGEVIRIPEVLFRYRKRHDGSSLIDKLNKNPEINRFNWQKVCNKHQSLLLNNQLGYLDLYNEINKLKEGAKMLQQKNEANIDKFNKLVQENKNLHFRIQKLQNYSSSYVNHTALLMEIYKSPSYKIIRLFKKINWRIRKKPKKQIYYPNSNIDGYLEAIKILSSVSWSMLAPLHGLYRILKGKRNF